MSAIVQGPFVIDSYGDFGYVVSDSGVRMAEVDGEDWRDKAEQVCHALNAVYYLAKATQEAHR